MFIQIFSIFLFLISFLSFGNDKELLGAREFNQYLKDKRPFSQYVKKIVTKSDCDNNSVVPSAPHKCVEVDEVEVDEDKLKILENIIESQKDFIKKSCRNPYQENFDKVMPELCTRFRGLQNFVHVFKKLEKCKSREFHNVDDYIDRLIDATSADAGKDFDDCIKGIKDSFALDFDTDQVVGNLSRALSEKIEKKEFKELSDFLIEDGLNESVKASLIFGAALNPPKEGDFEKTLNHYCPSEQNIDNRCKGCRGVLHPSYPTPMRLGCSSSSKAYVKKLAKEKLKSAQDIISKQNIKKSKDIINTKIELLNLAAIERNKAFKVFQKKFKKFKASENLRILNSMRGSRHSAGAEQKAAGERFKRKFLKPINQRYEIERSRILSEKAIFGTDELYQTDLLRKKLRLTPAGEKELKVISAVTDDDVINSFKEAKRRSYEQVAELIKLKEAVSNKEKGKKELSYRNRKKELMRLVRANPVSVGRALIKNPNYANNICKVAESLRKQKTNQANFDTAFMVIGVGTAVASFTATGGASSAVVLFTGAGAGLTLTGGELWSNYYYGNIIAQTLKDTKAAGLIGTGDSQTIGDIQELHVAYDDVVANAKITAVTGAFDLINVKAISNGVNKGLSRFGRTSGRKPSSVDSPDVEDLSPEDYLLWEQANRTLANDFPQGLSFEQFELVRDAHNVGRGEPGATPGTIAGIDNYTQAQKLRKYRILKVARLNDVQIRKLFENGVVGDADNYRIVEEAFKSSLKKTPAEVNAYHTSPSLVIDRNKEIIAKADEIGLKLNLITGTGEEARTLLLNRAERGHNGGGSVVDFNANPRPTRSGSNFSDEYGRLYRIDTDNLPPKGKSKITSPAITHPLIDSYLKRLEKIGVKVNVDTTIGFKTSIKASYNPSNKSISILPSTDWTTFLHEVQHAEFDHLTSKSGLFNQVQLVRKVENGKLITIRYNKDGSNLTELGRTVDATQDADLIKELGDKKFKTVTVITVKPEYKDNFVEAVQDFTDSYSVDEIKLIQKNTEKGYPKTAINERLSHDIQIRLIPEKDRANFSRSDNRELHATYHESSQLNTLENHFPGAYDESIHGKTQAELYNRFSKAQLDDVYVNLKGRSYSNFVKPNQIKGFKSANTAEIESLKKEYPKFGENFDKDYITVRDQELDIAISRENVKKALENLDLDEKTRKAFEEVSDLLHSPGDLANYTAQLQADVAKRMKELGLEDDLRRGILNRDVYKEILSHRAALRNIRAVEIKGLRTAVRPAKEEVDSALTNKEIVSRVNSPTDKLFSNYEYISDRFFYNRGPGKGVIHTDKVFNPDEGHSLIAHFIQQDYTYDIIKKNLETKGYRKVSKFFDTPDGRKVWDALYDSQDNIKLKNDKFIAVRTLTSPEYWAELLSDTENLKTLEEGH